ncbi:MAG: (2Fe-2S)-binding protein [Thermodesulfobacteriota bacterium]
MKNLSGNSFTEDIRRAPEAETVCYCSGTTKGDILRAVAAGARSLDEIKAATGACTQGRCRETSPRGR